jgi:hypothetical protein
MTRNIFRTIAVCTTITLSCLSCASSLAQVIKAPSTGDTTSGIIGAEKEFDRFEEKIFDPLINPNGLTFQTGGLPTGGGFSLGPRYTRRDLLREHLISNSYIVGSTKNWYKGQSTLDYVGLMNNHLQLTAAGAYQNGACEGRGEVAECPIELGPPAASSRSIVPGCPGNP